MGFLSKLQPKDHIYKTTKTVNLKLKTIIHYVTIDLINVKGVRLTYY